MRKILFILCFFTNFSAASIKEKEEDLTKYPKLSLRQENYISDNSGIINPNLLLALKPGHIIAFYLTDGTYVSALIKQTEVIDSKMLKVFGESLNQRNCGFGFVITEEEIFAGAIVFRDEQKIYTVKYSDLYKGYVLELQVTKPKIQ
jgi:hypothetical protein